RTLLEDRRPDEVANPARPPTSAPLPASEPRSTRCVSTTTPCWIVMLWPARCALAGAQNSSDTAAAAAHFRTSDCMPASRGITVERRATLAQRGTSHEWDLGPMPRQHGTARATFGAIARSAAR